MSEAKSTVPSPKTVLMWLAGVIAVAALAMVIVGLFLPREWEVEISAEIAAEREDIYALVSSVENWDQWMFDPDAPEALEVTVEGTGVGSTIVWSGGGSRGTMTLVELDPETGIRWEGKIESDEINNHGQLQIEPGEAGKWKVTIIDTGELPPVIGGYVVPVMNSSLRQHFEGALERLAAAAGARTIDGSLDDSLDAIEAAADSLDESLDAH